MMKYAVEGTYNFETMPWKEFKEFDADFEKTEEYDDAIYELYQGIPTHEEIDAVARKFDVPFDYVSFEGWAFVED